jgi:hypothetical protein
MPRVGLRLSKTQMEELDQGYQMPRSHKDFNLTHRIQGLLPVSHGMMERREAQILGVGRGALQDWIFRIDILSRGGMGMLVSPSAEVRTIPTRLTRLRGAA